jgi:hypothetical protein
VSRRREALKIFEDLKQYPANSIDQPQRCDDAVRVPADDYPCTEQETLAIGTYRSRLAGVTAWKHNSAHPQGCPGDCLTSERALAGALRKTNQADEAAL